MSVIIRLQNLPWSANALDIRQFFNGLSIPEGGVHIVGGELGDAFIAFSTDEDARQAFNRNGGKIKEIQIKLMLSSRTEMQKVIEAARNPLAAFMQTTPTPQALPAMIPAAVPAIIPEVKKEENKEKDKRERRRSRSRSRDRKERSRDRDRDRRDRRRRDRSRSRSRDRRDRRRRDRSHSRDRRSKDRDRRSKDRRQSEDKTGSSSNSSLNNAQKDQNKMGIWEDPVRSELAATSPAIQQAQALLNSFIPNSLEEARRNLNALAPTPLLLGNRNGFPNQNDAFVGDRNRDNWNANGPLRQQGDGRHDFVSRFNRNIQGLRNDEEKFSLLGSRGPLNPAFGNQRLPFNRQTRADGRGSRFDASERPGLLERPALLERPSLFERPVNDNLKNCCVQLRPYWGGYGEVRRFFHGIFIHNTGIKFINDDKGKRTGIVYIRFANPDGKEKALLRNGGQLKNQTVDIKHLDDDVFDKTVDRFQPDYGREQDQQSPDRNFKNKNNSPIFNKSPREFSCLAVEDLPLFTKEQDMLKIFSDYSLLSILLVNKQRHIIAYIKFSNSDDAKKAQTERGKHVFDGKALNIRACSDEEFAIISHEEPESDEVIEVEDDEPKGFVTSDCVSLTGLPLKTTDRDVTDFFSDVAIVPSKIHLITSTLGFTGLAFCEFSSIKNAESALDKDGFPLGSGTITVKSIPRSEMEAKMANIAATPSSININRPPNQIRPPFFPRSFGHGHFPGPRGMGLMGHRPLMRRFPTPPGDPSELAPPGCTVRMENVPYKAVLDEILDFFDGFDVPADNVLRRYNENGTPSGEAKVIFKSSEDAFQAVQERHHGKIRERTIFLSQC